MKRYIKINERNEIIDLFFEVWKNRFDGTEILLDETSDMSPYINGKCISTEDGLPLFKYVNGTIVEITTYIKTQAQLDSDAASKALLATDAKMPRVLEDIIDVLITKNTFRKNEMPIAVQELYNLKKELRSKVIK